jgi:ligand-binding sensor domain-containing protein/signal transduction histidine kinase
MKKNFIFFLLLLSEAALGQTFNFKNYNVIDDLPQAYIYTITQSPRGKLWIGTGEGLSNFDGQKFSNYTTADGLAENFIISSCLDRKGRLWFGHYQGGITEFDGNKFRAIDVKKFTSGPINVLTEDPAENLWLGSQNDGVALMDSTGMVHHFMVTKDKGAVNSISVLPSGHLLVGTGNGLYIYEYLNKNLRLVKKLLHDVAVLKTLKKRRQNEYWITTADSGLFSYIPASSMLKRTEADAPLVNKNINLVYEDTDHYLWLSFYGEGISRYMQTTTGLVKIDIYNTASGLSNNYVKSLFADRENNLWIGTFGGGMDHLIDPVFTQYTVNDGLPSDDITALYRDSNNLWAGSNGRITRLIFSKYRQNNLENKVSYTRGIPKGEISSFCNDAKGNLLIGTRENGIWKLDYQHNRCEKWSYAPTEALRNKINHMVSDHDHNIWIATQEGAYKYHVLTDSLEYFNMEKGLLHNTIQSIFVDSKNIVWFATYGSGLSSYKNGIIKNYPSPQQSAGIDINCFEEDANGNLWIGTYGQGIYIFNGRIFLRKYTQREGLGSNYCYLLIRDKNDNIWIGHKNGLSKYEYRKKKFNFHQKKDGFLTEEINSNACSTDEDDNIWFGTTKGLLKYNLRADKPSVVGPLIHLYDIRLFFQKVDWSQYSDSLFSLSRLPAYLTLAHDENHLTFTVKGISLSNPEKVRYKYKLLGFEKDWTLETNESFVTYSNMPPGKYTFLAIAKNDQGVWSAEPVSFSFQILNPIWKTWWFISLVLLVILILIILVVKERTKSLEKRQKQLQEEKVRLLAEIKERKKAERLQKISEEKLKQTNQELNTFIYRASHDLRGPLSTVKGLTNLGIMEIKDESSLKYFNHISDRIVRLDMILKDLIHIVEITEIDLDIHEIDLHAAIHEVLTELGGQSSVNNTEVQKDILNHKPFLNDPKLIKIILLNIIDNSFKYRHPEHKIANVHIQVSDYINGIKIIVSDNGVGIPAEVRSRIFDMFFRGTDQSKGSGLGLYLVNKIVGKLQGTVRVTSEYMNGTWMEIYLPSAEKLPIHIENNGIVNSVKYTR